MTTAQQQFTAYGPSHWAMLALFAAGAVALVLFARAHRGTALLRRFTIGYGVLGLSLYLAVKIYTVVALDGALIHAAPLHLSDFAGLMVAYALLTERYWAYSLSYYWCLSLSPQALFFPVFSGPDFPDKEFLAFWGLHLIVVWAGLYLTWGVGRRPTWRSYRIAVLITACWAAITFTVNSIAGTNYGYLNRKPDTDSILDVLGPWPWYLIPESTLILLVWALMTWPWTRTTRKRHVLTRSDHGG